MRLPRLGQGTWEMGLSAATRAAEVAALRLGLDLGMDLIDTAEMYAEGGAEEVVAEALVGRRDEVFVVSKVLPQNASRRGTVAACERSLRRLRTDRIDLYLLHWPGEHPVADTLAAFAELRDAGKILRFGVSNFDVHEMEEAFAAPHGADVAANQILYNPARRGVERRLLPWCAAHDVAVMAYSPLEQGRLARTVPQLSRRVRLQPSRCEGRSRDACAPNPRQSVPAEPEVRDQGGATKSGLNTPFEERRRRDRDSGDAPGAGAGERCGPDLRGALADVARRHGVSAAQVAIAWSMRDANVCSIPKAARPEHIRANAAARELVLDADDLARIDAAFPVPARDGPLETI